MPKQDALLLTVLVMGAVSALGMYLKLKFIDRDTRTQGNTIAFAFIAPAFTVAFAYGYVLHPITSKSATAVDSGMAIAIGSLLAGFAGIVAIGVGYILKYILKAFISALKIEVRELKKL